MPTASKRISQSKKTAFLAVYILILLALSEALMRFLAPLPEVSSFNRIDFTPLALDASLRAGTTPLAAKRTPVFQQRILWISDPDHFEFSQSLNLYGFRGETFPLRKTPGRKRIVFIGDSLVEGFGADDEHTIPVLVERELGGRVEALNLGVGGTGLPEYLRVAQVAVPLLKPDVVVCVIYQNDLPAPELAKLPHEDLPRPALSNPWRSRLADIVRDVAAHQSVALRFHRAAYAFFRPVPSPTNPLSNQTPAEIALLQASPIALEAARRGRFNPYVLGDTLATEDSLAANLDEHNGAGPYLREARAVVERAGAKLLVVYIPAHLNVSDYYYPYWNQLGPHFRVPSLTGPGFRKHQLHLGQVTQELGLPFVDATPSITAMEARGARLYHPFDSHMNAQGYGEVARLIAEELRRESTVNAIIP